MVWFGGTVMGEGLGFDNLFCGEGVVLVDAPPLGRPSRFGPKGKGSLISRVAGGCPFGLRIRSLAGGVTSAARLEDDEAGRAKGCEYGEGNACEAMRDGYVLCQ